MLIKFQGAVITYAITSSDYLFAINSRTYVFLLNVLYFRSRDIKVNVFVVIITFNTGLQW